MSKIFYNGIEFGGSSGSGSGECVQARDLTQAQYDALSSAEKNNGTIYFITDTGTIQRAEGVGF